MPKTRTNKSIVGLIRKETAEDINAQLNWIMIDWKAVEKRVYKLQKRIYQASSRDDVKTVRRLQKTLIKSWSAKVLAVRRVSQDNQGKKTAGVDGVKSLTPKKRLAMVNKLKLGTKVKPTRRVWIPKPGKDEKRPLGIPTMYDRALQALVKQAMEPEWEAKFEPNSYGFRPGRSCHDAKEAIFRAISNKAKYVLDADISKCFDKINHEKLLKKLNTFPTLRKQIRAWLKAGYMDGKELFPSNEGTPQGGVISPLLANIALHGMENRLIEFINTWKGARIKNQRSLSFIRYADDFVVIHKDISVIKECKNILMEWLKDMGLEISPSKTRICHSLFLYDENSDITFIETKNIKNVGNKIGFNFLGFNVKQYPVGKYLSGKNGNKELLGHKTLIKPSKEAVKRHYRKLCEVIDKHKGQKQEVLIKRLNPIIRGWCNYYSTSVSKEIFTKLDSLLYWKLTKWGIKRHSNKTGKFVASKYFHRVGENNWTFAAKMRSGKLLPLLFHVGTPIVRHIKVKGNISPYNGDSVYWSTRMGRSPEMPERTAILLKRQKGRCAHCGLTFKFGDLLEHDHIKPLSLGGEKGIKNQQLLHRHCHDDKTRKDGSLKSKTSKPTITWSKIEYKWINDMLVLMSQGQ